VPLLQVIFNVFLLAPAMFMERMAIVLAILPGVVVPHLSRWHLAFGPASSTKFHIETFPTGCGPPAIVFDILLKTM
jgi:hypothetical protein